MADTATVGRNEPCPCGSGKKYKRCCGVDAAPKISAPAAAPSPFGTGGMDPEALKNQFDPATMTQFAQMMGRLPKGQLQKLQSIMQKAMAGKDVTREAREFEQSLPVELQSLLSTLQMPSQGSEPMPGMPQASAAPLTGGTDSSGMDEDEARAIVEAAMKEGKISAEEGGALLKEEGRTPGGISKLWKKISGK